MGIPNIIVNVRQARLDEYAVRAMRKELELCSEGGDSGKLNSTDIANKRVYDKLF
jgi:hypothetical protein